VSRACVVIVNRDDPGVADTLEALAQPGVADGARVVVVDASRGRFADVAARFPEVTWIPFEQPAGVSRTIAQQRNVGLVAAGEDVVVFLDANCRPMTGWLDALLATVDARTLAAGAVRSPSGNSLHDAEHPHAWREDGTLGECSTLNLALPPQAVAAVGRFDESRG
jgi:glycosyltransferase involved in cell wall biosynthesis